MLFWRQWGMVSMLVVRDVVFETDIRHEFLSHVHKIIVVGWLVNLRYTMIKQQACIINVFLRRLMRVLAMRLKVEIILFIKLYHPSDGSSFTSVSTYLQKKKAQGANPPTLDVWGWEFLTWAHHAPLFSQRGCCVTRIDGHLAIAVAVSCPGPFKGKATQHTRPTCYPQNDRYSQNMCGTSGTT